MAETVYIVSGSRGEYSDRSEWIAAAFASIEEAKAFVFECEEAVRSVVYPLYERRWRDEDDTERQRRVEAAQKMIPDPALPADGYGSEAARYWIETVRLGRPAPAPDGEA